MEIEEIIAFNGWRLVEPNETLIINDFFWEKERNPKVSFYPAVNSIGKIRADCTKFSLVIRKKIDIPNPPDKYRVVYVDEILKKGDWDYRQQGLKWFWPIIDNDIGKLAMVCRNYAIRRIEEKEEIW